MSLEGLHIYSKAKLKEDDEIPEEKKDSNKIEFVKNENYTKKSQNTKESNFFFDIKASDLEKLMSNYKERGNDFKDLKYFSETKSVEQLVEDLKTNTETGLDSLDDRVEAFGSNKVFVEEVPHFCMYVWDALKDLMVRILIVAAIVSIVLGCTVSDDPSKDWIDGVSIVIAVLVVVLVGSITDYQKEQKFHELNEVQAEGTKYKLIRKGQPEDHISDDILVGDLIMINYGDIMPADVLLIEGNGIKMDESALTGESDAMKKEKYEKCMELLKNKENNNSKLPSPLILSGTNCVEGSGKGIVIAVGDHSQKGIIRRTVDNAQEDSQTPLEAKLERIAELIGYFGIGAGIVTLVALAIRFAINFTSESKEYKKSSSIETLMTAIAFNYPNRLDEDNFVNNIDNDLTDPVNNVPKKILNIIILCISIVVVAIPEGLPLAVTLSLAFSIKKMMDYNNLVRKMHACETMGGANYICTDKTGTLTKNEMSVFQVLTGVWKKELKQNLDVEEVGKLDSKKKDNNEIKQIREDYKTLFDNDSYWETLKVAVALNVDASIKKLEKENINGDMEICETKNKTDKAFIDFLYRFRAPISKEKDKYLKDESSFKQFPFDSKKKRMTTFVKNKEFPTGYRLFSKGGGENARVFCKYYMDPNTGEKKSLDDSVSMQIKQSIEEFNKDKLRSLYIAYKDIKGNEYENCEKEDSNGKLIDQDDLVFLAVFGIKDSLRDGVKEAVKKCHDASVNVIMVTGDNIVTATAIAKDCGILGEDVDLKNLGDKDIESDPEQIDNPDYVQRILANQPRAITGNSFYNIIGGLICDVCKQETNLCDCPKTESEAKQKAEIEKTEPKGVKKDVIKNMDNFKQITERLKVMARSQPMHKYALVLGLKALKNVVAVTGDGTNDAPALSKSDVGFAMFAGTDIAKEASDIVIIDNNFSSIVTAIIYGRNIYDNIRKFLQFQLSVNFCACILVFVCACVGNETPLTPIQMLWVNLIMDSLGSLALATEPPYEELLLREPTKRNESMINGRMWKHIIFQSFFQIILLVILYLLAPEFIKEQNLERLAENKIIKFCYSDYPGRDVEHIIYGTEIKWTTNGRLISQNKEFCGKYAERQNLNEAYNQYISSNCATTHMCLIFNIFVFYTLFNQFNCRVIDDTLNIFIRMNKSLLFPLICLLEMALQVVIIFVGKSPFHIVNDGLTLAQWGICIGFSAVTFVVSIILKFIPLELLFDKFLSKPYEEEVDIKEDEKDQGTEKINITRKNRRHGTNTVMKDSSKKIGNAIGRGGASSKDINLYSKK